MTGLGRHFMVVACLDLSMSLDMSSSEIFDKLPKVQLRDRMLAIEHVSANVLGWLHSGLWLC